MEKYTPYTVYIKKSHTLYFSSKSVAHTLTMNVHDSRLSLFYVNKTSTFKSNIIKFYSSLQSWTYFHLVLTSSSQNK